jgi:hypothetical protein
VPQHEILEPGPLLDGEGRLREPGWSRSPLLSYSRNDILSPLRRIKEWDYYCILAKDFGVAFTIADNGYIGIISASVFDFQQKTHITETYTVPFPLGAFSMPSSSLTGGVKIRHKKGFIDFSVIDLNTRVVKVDFPGFSHGQSLRGVLVLSESVNAESIVVATPWRKRARAFYYNRKVNCLAAEGVMQLGDEELFFTKDAAFGVLDWGRGVWPYGDIWYWGSASWLVEGKPFGLNIGYGFGDTSRASENAIFYDGKLHKLGAVTFHINPRDWLAPWRFTSDDGRLEMTMAPILDRSSKMNALVYSSVQHQVFGRYTGKAVLDDGNELIFSDIPGFAEKVKNRW